MGKVVQYVLIPRSRLDNLKDRCKQSDLNLPSSSGSESKVVDKQTNVISESSQVDVDLTPEVTPSRKSNDVSTFPSSSTDSSSIGAVASTTSELAPIDDSVVDAPSTNASDVSTATKASKEAKKHAKPKAKDKHTKQKKASTLDKQERHRILKEWIVS